MSGTLYLYISSNLGKPAGTSPNFVLLPRPSRNTGHISHLAPELFLLDQSRFRQVRRVGHSWFHSVWGTIGESQLTSGCFGVQCVHCLRELATLCSPKCGSLHLTWWSQFEGGRKRGIGNIRRYRQWWRFPQIRAQTRWHCFQGRDLARRRRAT